MTEQQIVITKEFDEAAKVAVEQALITGNVELTKALQTIINYTAKLKRATEALTAEIAYIAAESFEQTPTAHFPSDHDGIGIALVAYADILEEE